MIAQIKIVELPKRAVLKLSAVPIVLNQIIPVSEQSNLRIDTSGVGVPYDFFKYQLANENDEWSNIMTATIHVEVNSNTPDVTEFDITIGTNQSLDITSDFVFNDSTDRVKIISFNSEYGHILINGNDIEIGGIYMLYEFIDIVMNSNVQLTTQNVVSSLVIQAGNKNGFNVNRTMTITTTGNLQGLIEGTSNTNN